MDGYQFIASILLISSRASKMFCFAWFTLKWSSSNWAYLHIFLIYFYAAYTSYLPFTTIKLLLKPIL